MITFSGHLIKNLLISIRATTSDIDLKVGRIPCPSLTTQNKLTCQQATEKTSIPTTKISETYKLNNIDYELPVSTFTLYIPRYASRT